ncbi:MULTISPECIES: hypothetical protein [unclassified Rhizobium]|uniref:hypothetical protein n=1 Tax=unclassified Rhizobium TaxID=2613769 RepID=UPI0037FB2358
MAERMKIQIAEDRSGVEVEFLPESGATGTLALTQEQLLKLVQGLGRVHMTLVEGKDIPPSKGIKSKPSSTLVGGFSPDLLVRLP